MIMKLDGNDFAISRTSMNKGYENSDLKHE